MLRFVSRDPKSDFSESSSILVQPSSQVQNKLLSALANKSISAPNADGGIFMRIFLHSRRRSTARRCSKEEEKFPVNSAACGASVRPEGGTGREICACSGITLIEKYKLDVIDELKSSGMIEFKCSSRCDASCVSYRSGSFRVSPRFRSASAFSEPKSHLPAYGLPVHSV